MPENSPSEGTTFQDVSFEDVSTEDERRYLPSSHAAARRSATSQKVTIMIVVALALLVLLGILGSVMTIGDHLASANPLLSVVFYVLIAALVCLGVVYPIVSIARRPVFSLYQLRDEQGHAKRRWCHLMVDNLERNTPLQEGERKQLESFLDAGDKTDDLLIAFFKERYLPRINSQIGSSARSAFAIAAISRSALIDTVSMLAINLDLIRSIVEVCGFRPTRVGLLRLYTRVLVSALVAAGLEDLDLDTLVAGALGGGKGAAAGGIMVSSATQGFVNAYLVFRVGVITKKYLCAEDGPVAMRTARRESYREALDLMNTSGFYAEMAKKVGEQAGRMTSAAVHAAGEAAGNVARSVGNVAGSAVKAAGNAASSAVRAASSAAGNVASSMARGTGNSSRGQLEAPAEDDV